MLLHIGCLTRLAPSGLSAFDRKRNSLSRPAQLKTVAEGRNFNQNPPPNNRANNRSRKGASIENKKRRKGRPAWTRKPDDTPFRDGNRDRLVGLLTERAARTLCYYLSETNLNVHHWLMSYMQRNPIPRSGGWDDVSGETFLRNLLSMPLEHAKWTTGRDPLYDNIPGCGVDPRNLAQRVMAIRSQLALEFIEDLRDVSEENSTLLRESLVTSLSMSFDSLPVAEKPVANKDSSISAESKDRSSPV
ncbi:hypothetical protein ABBQ38_002652 [Trebouxia sp. C0009 RCD-2024]